MKTVAVVAVCSSVAASEAYLHHSRLRIPPKKSFGLMLTRHLRQAQASLA
eukprot:COSAG01_NODE_5677_length_4104_cov_81.566024_2_plen_50_part_00